MGNRFLRAALRGLTPGFLALAAQPAWAHTTQSAGWFGETWIVAALCVSSALYAAGAARLMRTAGRGHGEIVTAILWFVAGSATLAIALTSSLDELGAHLFSAHMVQHELLMLAAAPMLVLGRPLATWVWAFSPVHRRMIGSWTKKPFVAGPWAVLTHPLSAWLLHAAALWTWHLPRLFEAALFNEGIHALQHTCFLFSALLFWNAVLRPGHTPRASALVSVFTTMIHMGALGALLTLSGQIWYPAYGDSSLFWHLTSLEDQQLGGLIMWIPGGLVYFAVGLALSMRWLGGGQFSAAHS